MVLLCFVVLVGIFLPFNMTNCGSCDCNRSVSLFVASGYGTLMFKVILPEYWEINFLWKCWFYIFKMMWFECFENGKYKDVCILSKAWPPLVILIHFEKFLHLHFWKHPSENSKFGILKISLKLSWFWLTGSHDCKLQNNVLFLFFKFYLFCFFECL